MRIALVHDYLTQYGGAERVLAALHDQWPDAPIFTSIHDPDALPDSWRGWPIRTSWLGRLPGAGRWSRAMLPLYPAAFASFRRELTGFDVVLSDSSAFAHHAPKPPGAVHICYCHSPARFLWRDETYLAPARVPVVVRPALGLVLTGLRRLDVRAAGRVDRYVANSWVVAERLRDRYGVEAPVIYPPVAVERFAPGDGERDAPGEAWLVVSRLVPHKRVDLAVDAFTARGWRLDVVGDGRSVDDLRRRAGPTINFLGALPDDEVAITLRHSRGLILPGTEDFGITAVEAQAAGRPVVAFDAGGARESVIAGETGLFFPEPTPESLADTVSRANGLTWHGARCRANAARFSTERFQAEIERFVMSAVTPG